ncbi:hypothetical protein [Spiroplasma taiwanense]|uniref:hypothetical protein n=1 Tax=Spiroplasma taiwanense TaxID=2145 RepID=UPI00040FFA8D|nr:hypothetical protein [Spiroplasma taiwanense]
MIIFVTSIFLIVFLPFFSILVVEDLVTISISTVFIKTSIFTVLLMTFGFFYLISGILTNSFKNKPMKIFGSINGVIITFTIILLTMDMYMSPFSNITRIIWFFPTLAFLILDFAIEIIQISINFNFLGQNTSINNSLNQSSNNIVESVEFANVNPLVDVKDSTELKNKILNMRSGLNKPYDQAIEEIEQTGALNGLDMSNLLLKSDEQELESKIVPKKVLKEDIKDKNLNYEEAFNSKTEPFLEDPLANLSEDYESIHSTGLSRQDSRPEYKYISRRSNRKDNKH